jgi:putative RecB family exonuclease
VDYKTGRARVDSDHARGSRALALYAYAAERMFRRRCRRVELHHLPSGVVAEHEHTEESLVRHLRRAEETAGDILAAEQALAAGTDADSAFPTAPGPGCAWCDYRRSCPDAADGPVRQPWAAVTAVAETTPPGTAPAAGPAGTNPTGTGPAGTAPVTK